MVVLMPGSRHSEVKRLLAIMLATYDKVVERGNRVRYVLALADTLTEKTLESLWPTEADFPGAGRLKESLLVQQGETYNLLMSGDVALVASGTATLETALIGTPMVVLYRVNQLTYEIGKRVIQVPFIALANLVAERQLVKERIQSEANPSLLANDLHQLLNDKRVVSEMEEGYGEIRNRLSSPALGPSEIIGNFLSGHVSAQV